MKKFLLLASVVLSITSAQAQEKWRVLSFGATNSVNINGDIVSQLNTSLDYELKNNLSVSSWSGISHDTSSLSSWVASQTTLDKRFGNFTAGAGILYSSWGASLSDLSLPTSEDLFFTIKLKYQVKL